MANLRERLDARLYEPSRVEGGKNDGFAVKARVADPPSMIARREAVLPRG